MVARNELIGVSVCMVLMIWTAPAMAQQSEPSAESRGVLEEVVVTARKREESLQDVGQSVSAFGAGDIEARFADDIGEITDISPNLIIDDTAQGPGGVPCAASASPR